jgi:protein TonB
MKFKFFLLSFLITFAVNAQETEVVTDTAEERIYEGKELDVIAEYPGGINEFYTFIYKNYNVPEIKGNVKAETSKFSFVIEKDGSISSIAVIQDPGYGFAEEGVRVLKLLDKKWKPGIKDGKAVRSLMKFPIAITIQ